MYCSPLPVHKAGMGVFIITPQPARRLTVDEFRCDHCFIPIEDTGDSNGVLGFDFDHNIARVQVEVTQAIDVWLEKTQIVHLSYDLEHVVV